MTINRRRAPSSDISRERKLSGHQRESDYATMINGVVIGGTQKGDVKDKNGNLHSVKSGKKWQIFLYGYNRICNSLYLNILQPCLESFPVDPNLYFEDRIKCITFKEKYVETHGRDITKLLSNNDVIKYLGNNTYIESKNQLERTTLTVCNFLKDKGNMRNFLGEALFNNSEVNFLVIKDTTYKKDELFKIFSKDDVLDILSSKLIPSVSAAGLVPQDYNVAGQKTLFRYKKNNGQIKNIVEIEIRNDSHTHYRQVRFNMYSKDFLSLILNESKPLHEKHFNDHIVLYGKAIDIFPI